MSSLVPSPVSAVSSPLSGLFVEFMSRSETEQFLQQTLQTIQSLDVLAQQHQIVIDTTNQQEQHHAQQSLAEAAAEAAAMEDVNTHQLPNSASPQSQHRALSTTINITPPSNSSSPAALSVNASLTAGGSPSPRSPISANRSPGAGGRSLTSPTPKTLDPLHLQVDEVSLKASPTGGARRIAPIDAILSNPVGSPSPPGSPLASPNGMKKRNHSKPLNLPSSPRLTSPSPPRSPARHIASPLPHLRSPQSIRPFYFPEGVPASPTTRRKEYELIEQLWTKKDANGVSRDGEGPNEVGLSVEELFPITTLVCGFSSYCNSALFDKLWVLQQDLRGKVNEPALLDTPRILLDTFLQFHSREIEKFDLPTRFFRLLRSNAQPTDKQISVAAPASISAPSSSSSSSSVGTGTSTSPAAVPRKYLTRDDFKPIVQEIVNRHPGLEFLESTPEFQLKYAQTVIARIFYQVNKVGNECLTLRELRNSNFLLMLALLDQEDDINKLNDYFSYEHFYVIYCKFWELDEDHDGYIDANDLQQYDDFALTNKVVDRIMSGTGRKLLSPLPGKMNYLDFVVFLISEVDKNSDVSLDYWFNVVDLDGDGIITTYEIEYFFEEQRLRIQSLSQELITFPDIMCQLIDMVRNGHIMAKKHNSSDPTKYSNSGTTAYGELRLREKTRSSISSSSSVSAASAAAVLSSSLVVPTFHSHHKPFHSFAAHTPVPSGGSYVASEGMFYKKDLRESRMAGQLFNTLFNLNKFVLSEQRDPIRIKQIHDTPQLSDWDRYAISGYYKLAGDDQQHQEEDNMHAMAISWPEEADQAHDQQMHGHR